MSSKSSQSEYRISPLLMATIFLLPTCIFGVAIAAAETGDRESTSLHYSAGGRARSQSPKQTVDRYAPLTVDGPRGKSPRTITNGKISASVSARQSASMDFWFYSADVILFGDHDNDGYLFGIDLLFDVDTIWSAADVYAVTYLSYEGGPWNEYAATDNFTLFASSADDAYNIVTELEAGYPSGSYDLLIEIFDAQTDEFLASFGPEDTSALGILPLEDLNRDAPIFDEPIANNHGHGGGSTGIWGLLALLLARALRRFSVKTI